MPEEELTTLQVKNFPKRIRRKLNADAADEDITLSELLQNMYAFWSRHRKEEKEERKEKEKSVTRRNPHRQSKVGGES